MEADWELEVGPDAPVIDAAWSGLIDLRTHPEQATQLAEAAQFPVLAEVLARLNAPASPLWTSKCDVWDPGPIDPDEFDAPGEAVTFAIACYIDLFPATGALWPTLDAVAHWARSVCAVLRAHPLRQCRTDLVIRRAFTSPDETALAMTAYVAACAPSPGEAEAVLASALRAFADEVCAPQPRATIQQKLQ